VIDHFEKLVKLIHPLMPFITEEIWHNLRERKSDRDCVTISDWPEKKSFDTGLIEGFSIASEVVSQIRNIRKQNNIPNKDALEIYTRSEQLVDKYDSLTEKLSNVSAIHHNEEAPGQCFTFIVGKAEYSIPFGEVVDVEAQSEKIKEELEYTRGFLKSVQKKLSNEGFVKGAPEKVVATEKKKEADALAKIAMLEEQLNGMAAS
jgi:valyl-tRNA synthetase